VPGRRLSEGRRQVAALLRRTVIEMLGYAHGLQLTREPDNGFVWPIYRWARGESLAKVLASGVEGDMPAGDFVRWARQVIDLLGQLAQAAGPESGMRDAAKAAMDAVNRGVLAYTSIG